MAAVGTIIAAVVTVVAVLVAISSAKTGRESAERIAADDRRAADAALGLQMDAEWNARRSEKLMELLLKINEALAVLRATGQGSSPAREALQTVRVLGKALPPQPVFDPLRELLTTNQVANASKAQEETAVLLQKVVDVG